MEKCNIGHREGKQNVAWGPLGQKLDADNDHEEKYLKETKTNCISRHNTCSHAALRCVDDGEVCRGEVVDVTPTMLALGLELPDHEHGAVGGRDGSMLVCVRMLYTRHRYFVHMGVL